MGFAPTAHGPSTWDKLYRDKLHWDKLKMAMCRSHTPLVLTLKLESLHSKGPSLPTQAFSEKVAMDLTPAIHHEKWPGWGKALVGLVQWIRSPKVDFIATVKV